MRLRFVTLGDVAPIVRTMARRNAAAERPTQEALRDYVRALVEAYGYREDYRGSSPPWRVPYLPLPFAGEVFDYFERKATDWLGRSIPDGAKQPNFIRNRIMEGRAILGTVERGRVLTPNPGSVEVAPPAVAGNAPRLFDPSKAAGQPSGTVLTAEATWRFLYAMQKLAIHLDVLAGQPTKLEIFADEFVSQAKDLGRDVVDTLADAAELPRRVAGAGGDLLKWAAIAAVGLGALYVVSR